MVLQIRYVVVVVGVVVVVWNVFLGLDRYVLILRLGPKDLQKGLKGPSPLQELEGGAH